MSAAFRARLSAPSGETFTLLQTPPPFEYSRSQQSDSPHSLHKNASAKRLFSISYKRVWMSLKTGDFKSLYFHTHPHSFAGSPVFSTTSQKRTEGIPQNCPILGFSAFSCLLPRGTEIQHNPARDTGDNFFHPDSRRIEAAWDDGYRRRGLTWPAIRRAPRYP